MLKKVIVKCVFPLPVVTHSKQQIYIHIKSILSGWFMKKPWNATKTSGFCIPFKRFVFHATQFEFINLVFLDLHLPDLTETPWRKLHLQLLAKLAEFRECILSVDRERKWH